MGVSRKSLAFLLIAAMLTSSMLLIQSSSAAQSTIKPYVPEFKIMLVKHSYDSAPVTSTDPFTGNTTTTPSRHFDWLTVDLVITNQILPEQKQDEGYSFYSYNGLMFNVRFKGQYTNNWSNTTAIYGLYMPHTSGYKYTVVSLMLNNMWPIQSLRDSDSVQAGIQVPLNSTVDFQVEALYGKSFWCVSVPFGEYVFDGQESGWSSTQSITINETDAVSGPIYNPTVKVTTPTPAPTPSPTPKPTTINTPTPTTTPTTPNQKMDSITLPLTAFTALIAASGLTILGLILLLYRKHKKTANKNP